MWYVLSTVENYRCGCELVRSNHFRCLGKVWFACNGESWRMDGNRGCRGHLDGDLDVETCLASLYAICGYVDNYGRCASSDARLG